MKKPVKTDSFNIFREMFHILVLTFFAFFKHFSYHRAAFDHLRRSSAEPLRNNVKTVNVFRHQYQRKQLKMRKMSLRKMLVLHFSHLSFNVFRIFNIFLS